MIGDFFMYAFLGASRMIVAGAVFWTALALFAFRFSTRANIAFVLLWIIPAIILFLCGVHAVVFMVYEVALVAALLIGIRLETGIKY